MTDELDKFDLSAWEAPEPPADLADAVLARMGGTDVAAAMPPPAQPRRRVWLIAGVAAACLAATAGTYAFIRGGTRHEGPSTGSVVADRAQTLRLGDGISAELDAGAQVSWHRQGGALRVEQRAGAAAWRVSGDDQVWIDAGATVASVEATGASLRVEVKMNRTDTRMFEATALTAMAVSVVTVVVYEGHVKVSGSHGQPTVIVQPGSTYTVAPPAPPPDPQMVGASQPQRDVDPFASSFADLHMRAGDSATIHTTSAPVIVEFGMDPSCTLTTHADAIDRTTASFEFGTYAYSVTCTSGPVLTGSLEIIKDDAQRPLVKTPPVSPIDADGRTYRISFQSTIPDVKVAGNGVLHLAHGGTEQTFAGNIIPGTQLDEGTYTYWRDGNPNKVSTLIMELDQTAPVLALADIQWTSNTRVDGWTYPDGVLAVGGLVVPVAPDGRFSVVEAGDTITLMVVHRSNVHYFVLRSPHAVTVASGPGQLDRATLMRVMKTAGPRVSACGSKATAAGSGKVVVKTTIAADGSVSAATATSTFDTAISDCVIDVVRSLQFPTSATGMTFAFPFLITADPACNARERSDKGMENLNMGQHAAALVQFEAALQCSPNDAHLIQLAFMSACNSRNAGKAKLYFPKLSKQDATKLEQVCIRNKIDPRGAPAVPAASCDADALKDAGMEQIKLGEHAKALAKLEAALACKDDPYVRQIAFMEACASENQVKAQRYYAQLTPQQQRKFKMICDRNGVEVTDGAASASDVGYIQVFSKPDGKILIDGKDTGLTTPVTGTSLPLSPGKHKVTYVIGDDRFTYPVYIKAGVTETMSKDLQ